MGTAFWGRCHLDTKESPPSYPAPLPPSPTPVPNTNCNFVFSKCGLEMREEKGEGCVFMELLVLKESSFKSSGISSWALSPLAP